MLNWGGGLLRQAGIVRLEGKWAASRENRSMIRALFLGVVLLLMVPSTVPATASADPSAAPTSHTAPTDPLMGPADATDEPRTASAPHNASETPAPFLVGSGVYDITGPPADVMMAGYVEFSQTTHGIHTRLRSRAFVLVDPASGRRVVLVNIDQIAVFQAVSERVLERLRATFGDLYTAENVHIAATHTHTAPGGLSDYFMYSSGTAGFSQQNFDIVVDGIYQSIVRAHQSLAPGTVRMARGDLLDSSVSRSPDAYLLNPQEERDRYRANVDTEMTVLRFDRADGREVGALSWFAVHATSLHSDTTLISGDNKGYASYLFERAKGTRYDTAGTFVAAFANANAGDVSPYPGSRLNRRKEWECLEGPHIRCNATSGRKQYDRARALYDGETEPLEGGIDFRHRYVDFSSLEIDPRLTGGAPAHTCYGAIGLSMLAGTPDGIGITRPGQSCTDPSFLARLLCLRHPCHGVKPVGLATGRGLLAPLTPQVIPLQLIRIGPLVLIGVPAELTTMSGRRLRETVLKELEPMGVRHAVLAGYANAYAGYVATREEYQRQNYEGASTHFGEWTLAGYQQEMQRLAVALREGRPTPSSATPPDMSKAFRLRTPHRIPGDRAPWGKAFGSVSVDAADRYTPGMTVEVRFWGGYPNNDPLIQGSYLEVQRAAPEGWQTIAYDWDAETRFLWKAGWFKTSKITVQWDIPADVVPGRYRILHRGHTLGRKGRRLPYEGVSRVFAVERPGTVPADSVPHPARGAAPASGEVVILSEAR